MLTEVEIVVILITRFTNCLTVSVVLQTDGKICKKASAQKVAQVKFVKIKCGKMCKKGPGKKIIFY
jgi:hypothetical protein